MGLMGWFLTIYGRSADPVPLTAMSGDLKNYCHLNRQQMCFFMEFYGCFLWDFMVILWDHQLVGGLEHDFYDFPKSWDDDPI